LKKQPLDLRAVAPEVSGHGKRFSANDCA